MTKKIKSVLVFCLSLALLASTIQFVGLMPAFAATAVIPQSQMTATASSVKTGNEASKAIDGNNATLWHSQTYPVIPMPQSITLNLGGTYNVSKLRYQPRYDYTG